MIFRPHKPLETNIRGAFERHFRDTVELVFHIHLSQKVLIFDEFPAAHLYSEYHDLAPHPVLPGTASTGSWDPRYTPSRAHVSIRHQAARPPAGVSNYDSNLSRFSPHCMQIACNYRELSSSREAPKPHFPTFATLPSENLDFHQKKLLLPAAQPLAEVHGSLLSGVSYRHGISWKAPLEAP